ncbi:MAG: ribosome silencing factor [Pseudomonadota bacterium]
MFDLCPASGPCRRATQEDNELSLSAQAGNTASQGQPVMAGQKDISSEELLARILKSLDDDKAEDVVQIDLRGKSEMGDYMVVCSGRSTRQVTAISEKLVDALKQEYGRLCKVEGKGAGDWVLIDTGDVIVHVFRPEVREFYQLEKMWLPASEQAQSN